MPSYAATVNIRHISTGRPPPGKAARAMLTLPEAKAKALYSLRYITRASAAADLDIIGHSQGVTMVAEDRDDRLAMMEMTRWAINARAERHTETRGVRLADKLIISLPSDASDEHHREMVAGIISDLGADSDAWLVAAIHRDRDGNPHCHILAIDGLESRESAVVRRPDATRVRRRDHLSLNEGGNRPELRRRIAAQINAVSVREGYRQAEVRSLEAQGITRTAQIHEGPHGSARRDFREIDAWLDQVSQNSPVGGWDMDEASTTPQPLPEAPGLFETIRRDEPSVSGQLPSDCPEEER